MVVLMNREYHKWYGADSSIATWSRWCSATPVPRSWCFLPAARGFTNTKTLGWWPYWATRLTRSLAIVLRGQHGCELLLFLSHPQDRVHRHLQYEAYLLHEVLPLMWAKNRHPCVIAHGCSFGAYHAVNFAFRHPHCFSKVAAFSGHYDLTQPVEEDFRGYFDGLDELIYYNTPSHFLPNVHDRGLLHQLQQLDIVLTIGDADPFLDNNRQFSNTLWNQGIRHALHLWQGRASSASAWRKMVSLYV